MIVITMPNISKKVAVVAVVEAKTSRGTAMATRLTLSMIVTCVALIKPLKGAGQPFDQAILPTAPIDLRFLLWYSGVAIFFYRLLHTLHDATLRLTCADEAGMDAPNPEARSRHFAPRITRFSSF